MKKYPLILLFLVAINTGYSQQLENTFWLGTNAPSPNLWFHFGTDTLYYSMGSGYSPLSLYTDSNGIFEIFDLPGASLCTDTGRYNYTIVNPNLIFTLINDICSSRRNTFINYNWLEIPMGISPASKTSGIKIISNPVESFFDIIISYSINGDKNIILLDLNGRKVYEENFSTNTFRVETGFLPHAIYTGWIFNEGNYFLFKIRL